MCAATHEVRPFVDLRPHHPLTEDLLDRHLYRVLVALQCGRLDALEVALGAEQRCRMHDAIEMMRAWNEAASDSEGAGWTVLDVIGAPAEGHVMYMASCSELHDTPDECLAATEPYANRISGEGQSSDEDIGYSVRGLFSRHDPRPSRHFTTPVVVVRYTKGEPDGER